jgi:hypothetical protein
MPDPLTIVASVATTSRVVTAISTTLYRFIQDTKQVDSTVNALHREVNNLKRTVTAIENVLRQPATQAVIGQDQEFHLAQAVDDSLVECRNTTERLGERLEGIRGNRPCRGVLGQMIKQIRMNWNSNEIKTFRDQMHSHCLAMQLALQTINVYVHTYYNIRLLAF